MDEREKITYFAETDARNKKIKFGIKAEDRLRHIYSIGKTGMGKSTFLENMAIQDIQSGEGMAFLDPHGKTADLLLEYIPEHRIKDVVYFAPFDTEHPISFNVMEDVGPMKRHLVLAGLMSAFEKVFGEESFSDRMQYILQNTILALLEYPGATMLGINKMLSDKAYRNDVITHITDPSVKNYWTKEFAGYTDRFAADAIPAIQNKIGQFTSNPLIRNIIGQPKSSFDIRKLMDEKKILIVNLSKGLVGESNANLLGSMLVTKIYLAAMSRADADPSALKKLPAFYLYVDEFQSFANKSFADILSEARKYKLSLNITHQYIEQMPEEVRAAVFGNVGTMITFRVGSYDAEILEKEFAPVFMMEDLVNLGQFQIYLKLMINNVASQPFSATTLDSIPKPEISYKTQVIEASRATYTNSKSEVETRIKEWSEDGGIKPAAAPARPPARSATDVAGGGSPSQSSTRLSSQNSPVAPEPKPQPQPQFQPRPEIKADPRPEPKKPEVNNVLAKAIEAAIKEKTGSMNNEVSIKEEPKNQKPEPAPAPQPPARNATPNVAGGIPLNTLRKDDKNKNKEGTVENKNALADALKKFPVARAEIPRQSETKPVVSKTPAEVPEEMLRKVLNGES